MLDFVGTVDTAELPGGQFVVSVHGPLDGRIAQTLRDALLPLAGADGLAVLLDLNDAHGLDDPALEIVREAATLAGKRGDELRVISRGPFVTRQLVACGLGPLIEIYDSLGEATARD